MKFNLALPKVDQWHLLRQFRTVLKGSIITEDADSCM